MLTAKDETSEIRLYTEFILFNVMLSVSWIFTITFKNVCCFAESFNKPLG